MAGWDSIPRPSEPFQERLMEVFAGFIEHTDVQVGRLIDGIDKLGKRDNTMIFYIFGDNGASAEGQNGSISELLAQNQIPNTIAQQLTALDASGASMPLAPPRPTTCTMPAGHGRAVPLSVTPSSWPRISAARAIRS